jgi:hypothetical protein
MVKTNIIKTLLWSAGTLSLVVPNTAVAQTADELAKQTQNPIASLISVPFQGNWDFGIGTRQATANVLNFQPVIPFAINPSTNLVLRVIMPLASQPGPDANTRYSGMGDILTTAFFSPSKAGRLIWGAGPVILLPTATNKNLGGEKFGLGPSLVLLTQPGKWTLGFLGNHVWSTSGAIDRPKVNQTYLQPFANYNLGGGLAAGISMEATGNWTTDTWVAPLLFSLSKVTRLGQRPVNLAVAAGPTIVGPDSASSWRFRLSATFLFPR